MAGSWHACWKLWSLKGLECLPKPDNKSGRREESFVCRFGQQPLCEEETRWEKNKKQKEGRGTFSHIRSQLYKWHQLCVGRNEYLMVVQDEDVKKAPGWPKPLVPEDPYTLFSHCYPSQVQNLQQYVTWGDTFADCTSFLFRSGCGTFSIGMMISISYPVLNSSKSLPKDFSHLHEMK